MKIKELILYFQNCDSCLIEYNQIRHLYLNDIVQNYSFYKYASISIGDYSNKRESKITLSKECKSFILQLEDIWNTKTFFNELLITKIEDRDITQFKIVFEDDSVDEIFISWDDSEMIHDGNNYQFSHVVNEKYLNISVVKGEK